MNACLRILILFFVCCLAISFVGFPIVKGDIALLMSQGSSVTAAGIANINDSEPSDSSYASSVSQSFLTVNAGYPTILEVSISKSGSPLGYVQASLFAVSGSKLPTGSALMTSTNTVDISVVTTASPQYHIFYFNGTVLFNNNTEYCWVLSGYGSNGGANLNASNYVKVGGNNGAYANGSIGNYTVAGWIIHHDSNDFYFKLYCSDTDLTPQSTPGVLPTGGLNVDTSDADVVMSALINYGVPVVVMLLPVLFLWLIGGRGKWPFLMGIAIGTGMGYLFGLVPVWLVFIVSIVEVGMAYQSVRSGN